MPDACGRTFDETFLSGYLDRALVQGDEQRVRVHLEGCVSCRALLDELTSIRDATMSSTSTCHGTRNGPRPRVRAPVGSYADWAGDS